MDAKAAKQAAVEAIRRAVGQVFLDNKCNCGVGMEGNHGLSCPFNEIVRKLDGVIEPALVEYETAIRQSIAEMFEGVDCCECGAKGECRICKIVLSLSTEPNKGGE